MTQDYIGTKQITAWEQDSPKKVKVCGIDCKKGDASCNTYCTGGADRAPDHQAEPGYAVKYSDGYTSWSPKDIFEAAYIPIGHVGHLPPHQQRVIGEKAQLDDKINKLLDFMVGDMFAGLDEADRDLLLSQVGLMQGYSEVLHRRIDRF